MWNVSEEKEEKEKEDDCSLKIGGEKLIYGGNTVLMARM